MTELSQQDRPIGVVTPFGKDVLVLDSFSGEERMSELFTFDLQMLSEKGDLDPNQIIGKPVDFYVRYETDGSLRYFNGVVSRFSYLGQGDRHHMYRARVVPWLWMLTKAADCRVHESAESKNAQDIIDGIFQEFGFSDYTWKLKHTPIKRKYCLQYRETHYDFISRLLAEEGIYFYFEHQEGKHTLVLSDQVSGAYDCKDSDVQLLSNLSQAESTDHLTSWHRNYGFFSGAYAHTDYDFENPSSNLLAEKKTKLSLPNASKYEFYDHPGGYIQKSDGDSSGEWRIEAEEYTHDTVLGSSKCRSFSPGGRFKVAKHFNTGEVGKKWVMIAVQHRAQGGSFVSGGGSSSQVYSNTFHAIPDNVVFRPVYTRTKPKIHGLQSALVVGPSGEEIYTDKYGRIKVQFHWDRNGKKDDNSSMWVRVVTPWAGKNWGMISIPRIGQEVIVDFLDGDVDRPIVMGMVYNAENMPPYGLPDNMTQSGVKTRSSKGGGDKNFNEIRFEDKKDKEEIYIHAERDLNCVIENNETRKVGFDDKKDGDQTIEIYNNQTVEIGRGSGMGNQVLNVHKDRTVTIETGNDALNVQQGNLSIIVDKGNVLLELGEGNQVTDVKQGNQVTEIGMGNQETTIKMGNQKTALDLGKSETEAMQSIELKVGSNSIKIDQMGVTIKGMMVKVEGTAMADLKAPMTTVKGDGMLTLKGGITMIN